jgi:hypothetical protein
VVIVSVFAALVVSVVNARRPLDTRVSRSFDATIPTRFRGAAVSPRGCRKVAPNDYRCDALMHLPRLRAAMAHWRLLLSADGCWTLLVLPPYPDPVSGVRAKVIQSSVTGCAG